MIPVVSQIAWSTEEEEAVLQRLQCSGIAHLELAPGRLAPDPLKAEGEAAGIAGGFARYGLTPLAFQSLLFLKPELRVFGENAQECADYLIGIGKFARSIGVDRMVFGSPVNRRVPEGWPREKVVAHAIEFFRAVGEGLKPFGVVLALETNPVEYQSNFATTLAETVEWLRAVDHPNVGLNLDTGALTLTGESVELLIAENVGLVRHVHISEPMLAPLSVKNPVHGRVLVALRSAGYSGSVSLEMKRPAGGLKAIGESVDRFMEFF